MMSFEIFFIAIDDCVHIDRLGDRRHQETAG